MSDILANMDNDAAWSVMIGMGLVIAFGVGLIAQAVECFRQWRRS